MSQEERIRRAEEIYYSRRADNNYVRMSSSQVKDGKEKRQYSLYKKMAIQMLICILIYLIFSLIKQTNYIFSEDVVNKTKELLSKDINFEVLTGEIGKFFQENQDKLDFLGQWLKEDKEEQNEVNVNEEDANVEKKDNESKENENKEENKEQENKTQNTANSNTSNTKNGIGGEASKEVVVTTSSASSAKKTQMQIDAEYVKKNFSLVLPAKGTITSNYGTREATEIVSANHQGIDVGVNEGTTVVAAMEGKVSLVSNQGEYGTHVKIVNKDITTIYAHCSKILVKEGENIKKGQKIALSGNTGRTTGPHLHFEIRRENRTIDPKLILDWK